MSDLIIRACPDSLLTAEAFREIAQCSSCQGDLVPGKQIDIRLDADHSMNVSRHSDPDNIGVKIMADLHVKICLTCGWAAVEIETVSYAGY